MRIRRALRTVIVSIVAGLLGGLAGWVLEGSRPDGAPDDAKRSSLLASASGRLEALLDSGAGAFERRDPVALADAASRARALVWAVQVEAALAPAEVASALDRIVDAFDMPTLVIELLASDADALARAVARTSTDGVDKVAWARVTSALAERPALARRDDTEERVEPDDAPAVVVTEVAAVVDDAPPAPPSPVSPDDVPLAVEGLAFVRLAAGSYRVGDARTPDGRLVPRAVRNVTLDQDVFVATTETTQQLYAAVMGARPWEAQEDAGWHGPDLPAHSMTYEEAEAFCEALTRRFGGGVWVFRLPTAVEWEVAARGGWSPTESAFGFSKRHHAAREQRADLERLVERYALYRSPKDPADRRPVPVGGRLANRLGLFDVHGNVAEWVQPSRRSSVSAVGMPTRGGNLLSLPWATRAPHEAAVAGRSPVVGVRVVAERAR